LALLGQTSGAGSAQDRRTPFRQRTHPIESRAEQGDL
jgi:hypothetical protein